LEFSKEEKNGKGNKRPFEGFSSVDLSENSSFSFGEIIAYDPSYRVSDFRNSFTISPLKGRFAYKYIETDLVIVDLVILG